MFPNANLKALLIFQHRGKKVDQELETCHKKIIGLSGSLGANILVG